jgi:hypothetical protein
MPATSPKWSSDNVESFIPCPFFSLSGSEKHVRIKMFQVRRATCGMWDDAKAGENGCAKSKLKLQNLKARRDKENLGRNVSTLIAWKRFRN